MTEIIKRDVKQYEFPIENAGKHNQTHPGYDLKNAEVGVEGFTFFDLAINLFRIVAEKAEEHIAPHIFRLIVVAMTINRDRINRFTGLIRTVAIALMMPVMHQIVKLLGKPHGYRKQPTESVVQRLPFEVRVMDKVVRDPVYIPRNADGINESQYQHYPQG